MKLTLSFLFSLIVGLAFAFPQTTPTLPPPPPPPTPTPAPTGPPPPTTTIPPTTPPTLPPTTTPTTVKPKCCNSNVGYASGHNRNPGCTGNTVLGGAIKGMTGLASWFAHEINILLGSEHLCPPKQCENPCDQIPPIVNTTELAQQLICEPETQTTPKPITT